jgi:hypothetical protein
VEGSFDHPYADALDDLTGDLRLRLSSRYEQRYHTL